MKIGRERYLDDTTRFPLELSLLTRSSELHSLLSNVPQAERDAIGEILVSALDAIAARLRGHIQSAAPTAMGRPSPG
jgi:hypothetical protein